MSNEDQKLMEQISLLAGQINRAKNQQAGLAQATSATPSPPFPSPGRGGYHRGRHQYTATGRAGYRVAKPVHRHRSLVLNGPSATNNANQAAGSVADDSSASSSWVTRNDRHLQLINSSVFQEHSEARARAMQQTRLHKQQEKEHRERVKLMSHLKHIAQPSTASVNPASLTSYEIVVEGIRFRVANNGSKLVKLPGASRLPLRANPGSPASGDPNGPKATPKMALVGGVKFHRSKNGNMYRQAIVKAHRQSVAIKKINVVCRNFSNTVCQSFGIYGYCDKGISCSDRHVFECPDFSNTGVCKTKGCKLTHRERASVLRKANAALEQNASEDCEGDLSSDDDNNSVSSDDVDSDEVEEFIGEEDPTDFDKDFISLS
ncbi:hypothetical protein KVR01_010756 [Diaporthe batatas]|uniref:uncharacterized protein n=1 Tax=Diaporthe batatas TaxID=748121 RepID=UPI001D04BA0B|nr:uncharacterized protein KVR01_010756 [Diaporthe batatas]KAG8159095.1 hypothetical protein KVR01_010756 [Diaporthe batatas]